MLINSWYAKLNTGGDDLVQIVTGAPNVFEGAYVPVALHKSRIPRTTPRTAEAGRRSEDNKGKTQRSLNLSVCSVLPANWDYEDKVIYRWRTKKEYGSLKMNIL